MNDLRFPGLRSPLPAVTRPDAVLPAQAARGAAVEPDAGDDQRARFDRSLQRSVEADRSSERRQAVREPAVERAREASRQPQRPVERAVDRSTERAQAQSQQARREQNSAMNRSTPDRDAAARPDESAPATVRDGVPAPADTAAHSSTHTADAEAAKAADGAERAAVPTALQPTPVPPVAERPDATAALVAASAALTAAARATADAAATGTATDAALAEDVPTSDALPGSLPAAATAARGKAARAADDEPLDPGARTGRAAIPDLSAELTRTPAKDRLLEDFERRFENSLARAVGAGIGGASPLNTTSPLLAAGLPQQLAPTLGAPSVATAAVPTPLGHPAFGEDLSQRVMLFAGQRVQSAELTVTPADMGPISVSIEVRGQEAAMQFAASHATTRAAIEDALPRLREMLAAQGLQLTQADVGDRAPRDPQGGVGGQGGQSGQGGAGSGPWSGGGQGARGAQAAAEPVVRRIGLIDIRV